jgi:hypothetical protein
MLRKRAPLLCMLPLQTGSQRYGPVSELAILVSVSKAEGSTTSSPYCYVVYVFY